MTYLISPQRVSTINGSCNCGSNSGNVTNGSCITNNSCSNNTCGGHCLTLKICVTPTGVKVSPGGVGTTS